jgi:hypothetical protein
MAASATALLVAASVMFQLSGAISAGDRTTDDLLRTEAASEAWEATGSLPTNLANHPRLRLTPAALVAMKATIASDPLAATVSNALQQYGETLLKAPVVNCSLAGVEHSASLEQNVFFAIGMSRSLRVPAPLLYRRNRVLVAVRMVWRKPLKACEDSITTWPLV